MLLAGAAMVPGRAWAQDSGAEGDVLPPPLVEIDPDAPLDPLPGLDLDWPEIRGEEADPEFEPLEDLLAEEDEASANEEALLEADIRDYRWELVGLPDDEAESIETDFDILSTLETSGDADNAAQIDRRAQTDLLLLESILDSRGYYAATIDLSYVPQGEALLVRYTVDPGQQFRFTDVQFPGLSAAQDGDEAALREAYGIGEGDAVVAADVIGGTVALTNELGQRGYATAQLGERQVIIDYTTATATLVQPVTTGPVARYGTLTVEGNPPFPPRHVQRIARFEPGEIYNRDEIVDLRLALIETGLVSSAVVETEPREGNEVVDVAVRLEPAQTRTIAAEVGFGTGEGFRVEGEWQHRNFWNPEGALTLRGILGTQEQLLGASMVRSNWLRRDQRLSMTALASNIDRQAYEAETIQLSGRVERVSDFLWQKEWTWGAGVELIATREVDSRPRLENEDGEPIPLPEPQRLTYFIGALPLTGEWDRSNDLLDPTEGFTVSAFVSPEVSFQGDRDQYVRSWIQGTYYQPINDQLVVAGKLKTGTITGTDLLEIAPSRRLYAGGGSSVRGYGFQQLGPRDEFGDPVGGKSVSEVQLEARYRVFGQFAVVPFVDAGRVSSDAFPGEDDWQVGVGIGVRYHSNFGPLRVDVGTPLNPREGDGPVAVVVGLGQAF
ncbi:BamA/TamA family outer membrane protein [Sphingomicrobium sp. XHP0239]|uniref:autotransporter assembly complex protein TamA n=1 Tax=Sphingomicrobium maritimum TaxID=3133972 RepID=UPI0031CC3EA8